MENNLPQQTVSQNPWKQPGRIKGLIFSIVSLNFGISAIMLGVICIFMGLIFGVVAAVAPSDAAMMAFSTFFSGYYSTFTAIYAIPGIIFGVLAKKIAPFKMASAGVVLSIVGIALAALTFILGLGLTLISF